MNDDQMKELVRRAQEQAQGAQRNAEQVVGVDGVHAFVTLDAKPCDHEWVDGDDGNPSHCALCGMGFLRYCFQEMP
jgi:hypothetical protein